MIEIQGQSEIQRKKDEKLVISYRDDKQDGKDGSFSVLNIEEDVSKIDSSVDRGKIFRKMKKKIIDLETAVHNVNDILEKQAQPLDKLAQIDECINFWKPKNNFHEVQGQLTSQFHQPEKEQKIEKQVQKRQAMFLENDSAQEDTTTTINKFSNSFTSDLLLRFDGWEQQKQRTVDFYQKQIKKLTEMCEQFEEKYQNLMNQFTIQKEELQNQRDQLNFEIGIKSEIRKSLQKQVNLIETENKNYEKEISLKNSQIESIVEQNRKVKAQNKKLVQEKQILEGQKQMIQEYLKEAKQFSKQKIQEIQKMISHKQELKSQSKQLQKEMQIFKIQHASLVQRLNIAEQFKSALEEQLAVTKQNLIESNKELQRRSVNDLNLENQNKKLQESLHEKEKMKKKNSLLEQKIKFDMKEHQKTKQQLKHLKYEIQILKTEFDCKQKKDSLQQEIILEEKINYYEQILNQKKQQLSACMNDNKDLKKMVKTYKGQKSALQIKMNELQSQKQQDYQKYQHEIQKATFDLSQKQKQLQQIQLQHEKVTNMLQKLDLSIDSFVNIDKKSNIIHILRKKLQTLLKDKEKGQRQSSYKQFFDLLKKFKVKFTQQQLYKLRQSILFILS